MLLTSITNDIYFSALISFFSFLGAALLFAYILGFKWNLHGKGIWWGLTLGTLIGAISTGIRLCYILKRIDLKKLNKL